MWNDRLENLPSQFSATHLGATEIQQSLESAQDHAIQSQEANILSALAEDQSYIPKSSALMSLTPGLQLRSNMEKIEDRIQSFAKDLEKLKIPSSDYSAYNILMELNHLEAQIRNEQD